MENYDSLEPFWTMTNDFTCSVNVTQINGLLFQMDTEAV